MAITQSSDHELLVLAGQGDGAALGELYDRHGQVLFGLACRLLYNSDDGADLVHDVFLEAWQKASQYNPARASVRSWLILRLRSRAIDRIRTRDLHRASEAKQVQDEPVDDIPSLFDHDRVVELLAKLSEPQRTVLTLSYFRGFSCQEIARQTGVPLGTIKSRLGAATSRLKHLLQQSAEVVH